MADPVRIVDGSAADVGIVPLDVSENAIYLLPRFSRDGKHVFSTNTSAVRKMLIEQGLTAVEPKLDGEVAYRDERSFTWLGPTLLVTLSFVQENPHAISVALGVISNYVTDLFKGKSETESTVKLDIIVETKRGTSYRRVSYSGPASGLSAVPSVVESSIKNP